MCSSARTAHVCLRRDAPEQSPLGGAAGCGGDGGAASCLQQMHRRQADPSCGRMYQHPAPGRTRLQP